MKFRFILLILLSVGSFLTLVMAQDKPAEPPKYGWQKSMVGGINLTQTAFDNWKQGGENTFAWQATINYKFVNDQEKTNWSNTGKFTLGATKAGDLESRKSIDEIKLETVYTQKLGLYVNPFLSATGETQFISGYDYKVTPKNKISNFMDPAYFRESAGVGYQPNQIVKTRLGVALKQTVTQDFPIPYADDPKTLDKIEKFKNEVGAESVTDLSWKVAENSLLVSKLELFSTLDKVDEIDVNWDNVFTTKISKYFNVNLNFKLFYDKDISKKRQIKQAIAFGFNYTFL